MTSPARPADAVAAHAAFVPYREAGASLTQPGGPFEVAIEEVLGQDIEVFVRRPRSLGELLAKGATHGDRPCLIFSDGRRITFAELPGQVASVASYLRDEHGVGQGDRVAICAANCAGWILAFWAISSLGAVTVAMNGWWTEHEMRHALALTDPKLLLLDAKRAERLGETPGLDRVDLDAQLDEMLGHAPGRAGAVADRTVDEDDPAVLMFTSGTTGRPKAAVLTHRVLLCFVSAQSFIGAQGMAFGRAMAASRPAPTPDATAAPPRPSGPLTRLAVFPLFHISGLCGVLAGIDTGSTTVWPLGRFDAGSVIELTVAEGIDAWTGTGTHLVRLLDHPDIDRLDPMQLRAISMGGSATTPDIIRRADARFPHLAGQMSSGYGATEVGGVVTFAPNWMLTVAPDCVGPPLPTVQIKITDEHAQPLPDGDEGDVWVRGPSVMPGYWRNDDADADAIDAGRWYRTGDYGRIEHGLLFIASRKRDLILRGGENVYPFEIENCIEEHPEVLEVAVVGVDHHVLGQEVRAVIVTSPGSDLTAEDIRAHCGETLAPYKVPVHIDLRTELLPRNASGKILKHALDADATTFIAE